MTKRGFNELNSEELKKLAKATLEKKIADKEWVNGTETNIYTRDK